MLQEKALVMQMYKKTLGVSQTSTQSQGHTENILFSSKVPAPYTWLQDPHRATRLSELTAELTAHMSSVHVP